MTRSVRDELLGYQTSDPFVLAAIERALGAVSSFVPAQSLAELRVCLINPAVASRALLASEYYTPGCQALLKEQLIVVNEEFLLSVESTVRSFAHAETMLHIPYVQHDAQMFGLVRQIQADPARYLARLRRHAARSYSAEEHEQLATELAMVALFVLGHELGHFLLGHPASEFVAFLEDDTPLESRLDDASVKLCQHADEFARYQFGLQGFEEATAPLGRVRRSVKLLRLRSPDRYRQHEAFFANEAEADDWANRVVIAHLKGLSANDPAEADRQLFALARGLFAVALYTFYRDLDLFSRKLGTPDISDTRELDLSMMQGRQQYVYAASLFGERHRFTSLRAALALEAVLRACTDWFSRAAEERSIWCEHSAAEVAVNAEFRRAFWLSEVLQRYFLLCASMDTAVKLSMMGCSTSYMLDKDRARGTPQMFVMQFMGLDHMLKRVKAIA